MLLAARITFDQAKIDLAIFYAGLQHNDPRAIAEAIFAATALAGERLAHRIEVVEIIGQLGYVNQAIDFGIIQFHEQAEAGHATDGAVELFAHMGFHPRGAVAFVHFALGFVGTAPSHAGCSGMYPRCRRPTRA